MTSTNVAERRPPRVVILGGGMIAGVHRRAAVLAGGEIVGVMDATPAAGVELARRWGVGKSFDTIEDVAASNADIVHVCTPNFTHAPYAAALLEAGKHVICEKPLGIDVAEAEMLRDLADERGLVAVVPYIYRYHPLVREIRQRRIAGEFGPWNLLHGSYLQDWLLSPGSTNWRVDPRANGLSRAFADIGSHWCDLVEWVSGEQIAELTAAMSIAVTERPTGETETFTKASDDGPLASVQTEDIAQLIFRTTGGVPGSVTISQVSAGRKNRLWFELDGVKGSAVFDQENPETVWLGREDGAEVLFRDPGMGSQDARRLSTLPAGHPQGYAQCFEGLVSDAYAAVRGEYREGLPTFADGARSLRIVEAALESAKNLDWRKVRA